MEGGAATECEVTNINNNNSTDREKRTTGVGEIKPLTHRLNKVGKLRPGGGTGRLDDASWIQNRPSEVRSNSNKDGSVLQGRLRDKPLPKRLVVSGNNDSSWIKSSTLRSRSAVGSDDPWLRARSPNRVNINNDNWASSANNNNNQNASCATTTTSGSSVAEKSRNGGGAGGVTSVGTGGVTSVGTGGVTSVGTGGVTSVANRWNSNVLEPRRLRGIRAGDAQSWIKSDSNKESATSSSSRPGGGGGGGDTEDATRSVHELTLQTTRSSPTEGEQLREKLKPSDMGDVKMRLHNFEHGFSSHKTAAGGAASNDGNHNRGIPAKVKDDGIGARSQMSMRSAIAMFDKGNSNRGRRRDVNANRDLLSTAIINNNNKTDSISNVKLRQRLWEVDRVNGNKDITHQISKPLEETSSSALISSSQDDQDEKAIQKIHKSRVTSEDNIEENLLPEKESHTGDALHSTATTCTSDDPVISTSDDPTISTSDDPMIGASDTPLIIISDDPMSGTSDNQIISTSTISANHDPITCTSDDRTISTSDDPTISASDDPTISASDDRKISTSDDPTSVPHEQEPLKSELEEEEQLSSRDPAQESVEHAKAPPHTASGGSEEAEEERPKEERPEEERPEEERLEEEWPEEERPEEERPEEEDDQCIKSDSHIKTQDFALTTTDARTAECQEQPMQPIGQHQPQTRKENLQGHDRPVVLEEEEAATFVAQGRITLSPTVENPPSTYGKVKIIDQHIVYRESASNSEVDVVSSAEGYHLNGASLENSPAGNEEKPVLNTTQTACHSSMEKSQMDSEFITDSVTFDDESACESGQTINSDIQHSDGRQTLLLADTGDAGISSIIGAVSNEDKTCEAPNHRDNIALQEKHSNGPTPDEHVGASPNTITTTTTQGSALEKETLPSQGFLESGGEKGSGSGGENKALQGAQDQGDDKIVTPEQSITTAAQRKITLVSNAADNNVDTDKGRALSGDKESCVDQSPDKEGENRSEHADSPPGHRQGGHGSQHGACSHNAQVDVTPVLLQHTAVPGDITIGRQQTDGHTARQRSESHQQPSLLSAHSPDDVDGLDVISSGDPQQECVRLAGAILGSESGADAGSADVLVSTSVIRLSRREPADNDCSERGDSRATLHVVEGAQEDPGGDSGNYSSVDTPGGDHRESASFVHSQQTDGSRSHLTPHTETLAAEQSTERIAEETITSGHPSGSRDIDGDNCTENPLSSSHVEKEPKVADGADDDDESGAVGGAVLRHQQEAIVVTHSEIGLDIDNNSTGGGGREGAENSADSGRSHSDGIRDLTIVNSSSTQQHQQTNSSDDISLPANCPVLTAPGEVGSWSEATVRDICGGDDLSYSHIVGEDGQHVILQHDACLLSDYVVVDIVDIANLADLQKDGHQTRPAPTSTPHTAAVPTSTPHTAAIPTSTPHTAAIPTSTLNTATVPNSTPHTVTVPTSTLHIAAVPDSTPHTATVPTSTPHTAAVPTSTPHTAAIPTSTLHTAAVRTPSLHTAAVPNATPHTAAVPTSTPHTDIPTSTPHTAAVPTSTPHTAIPTSTPHTVDIKQTVVPVTDDPQQMDQQWQATAALEPHVMDGDTGSAAGIGSHQDVPNGQHVTTHSAEYSVNAQLSPSSQVQQSHDHTASTTTPAITNIGTGSGESVTTTTTTTIHTTIDTSGVHNHHSPVEEEEEETCSAASSSSSAEDQSPEALGYQLLQQQPEGGDEQEPPGGDSEIVHVEKDYTLEEEENGHLHHQVGSSEEGDFEEQDTEEETLESGEESLEEDSEEEGGPGGHIEYPWLGVVLDKAWGLETIEERPEDVASGEEQTVEKRAPLAQFEDDEDDLDDDHDDDWYCGEQSEQNNNPNQVFPSQESTTGDNQVINTKLGEDPGRCNIIREEDVTEPSIQSHTSVIPAQHNLDLHKDIPLITAPSDDDMESTEAKPHSVSTGEECQKPVMDIHRLNTTSSEASTIKEETASGVQGINEEVSPREPPVSEQMKEKNGEQTAEYKAPADMVAVSSGEHSAVHTEATAPAEPARSQAESLPPGASSDPHGHVEPDTQRPSSTPVVYNDSQQERVEEIAEEISASVLSAVMSSVAGIEETGSSNMKTEEMTEELGREEDLIEPVSSELEESGTSHNQGSLPEPPYSDFVDSLADDISSVVISETMEVLQAAARAENENEPSTVGESHLDTHAGPHSADVVHNAAISAVSLRENSNISETSAEVGFSPCEELTDVQSIVKLSEAESKHENISQSDSESVGSPIAEPEIVATVGEKLSSLIVSEVLTHIESSQDGEDGGQLKSTTEPESNVILVETGHVKPGVDSVVVESSSDSSEIVLQHAQKESVGESSNTEQLGQNGEGLETKPAERGEPVQTTAQTNISPGEVDHEDTVDHSETKLQRLTDHSARAGDERLSHEFNISHTETALKDSLSEMKTVKSEEFDTEFSSTSTSNTEDSIKPVQRRAHKQPEDNQESSSNLSKSKIGRSSSPSEATGQQEAVISPRSRVLREVHMIETVGVPRKEREKLEERPRPRRQRKPSPTPEQVEMQQMVEWLNITIPRRTHPIKMLNGDVCYDQLILEVFEESDTIFFPIHQQKDARSFIKALHMKGVTYESLCQEIGEHEHNFTSWRKSLGRAGIGHSVMKWANQPLQDLLDDGDEDEDDGMDDTDGHAEQERKREEERLHEEEGKKRLQPEVSNEKARSSVDFNKNDQKDAHDLNGGSPVKNSSETNGVTMRKPKEASPPPQPTKDPAPQTQKYEQEVDLIRLKRLEEFKKNQGTKDDECEQVQDVRKRISMFEQSQSSSKSGSTSREESMSPEPEDESRTETESVSSASAGSVDDHETSPECAESSAKSKSPEPAVAAVEQQTHKPQEETPAHSATNGSAAKPPSSSPPPSNSTTTKTDQVDSTSSAPDITENYNSDLDPDNDMHSPVQAVAARKIAASRTNKTWGGFLYVFSDTPANSDTCRVKVGASAFPHKRLRQAQLFNPNMYQVHTVAVKQRSAALEEVLAQLETYRLQGQRDWFEGPFNDLLAAISDVAARFPRSSRKIIDNNDEDGDVESAC